MAYRLLGILKLSFVSIFLTLFLNSCAYKNPISGSTNFHSLISGMVDDSANKIKKNVSIGEVVLVSDFVNLDKLKNRSQLGFLLSSMLKDKLSSLDIIVKEIELGKEFEFGPSGFNLLTREKERIIINKVKSKYAVVGTYSISSRSLNVFIRLIDIQTGNILSSSYGRTDIDDEILGLEGSSGGVNQKSSPPAQRPFLVL
ncbi:MAG: FlgO family outer membrane protein [Arcobacter sp.]|uniref:FlgO family outer membrane protein n=1 Tax=Arcobacter sp. TaxID=1872629 RepID=UPI002583189C|nr:FlgO family outer membrane protein [Arcobacter sp.]MDD3009587.1 FlgO family outer membrane protein [Arcobacter sp.]